MRLSRPRLLVLRAFVVASCVFASASTVLAAGSADAGAHVDAAVPAALAARSDAGDTARANDSNDTTDTTDTTDTNDALEPKTAPVVSVAPVLLAATASASSAPPTAASTPASAVVADAGAPKAADAEVRLKERPVFTVLTGHAGATAEQRATAASGALARVLEDKSEPDVRIVSREGVERIFVGDEPIIDLEEADEVAAHADSLDAYSAQVAGDIRTSLKAERRRAQIAGNVFSVSLLVFVGLLAYLALRRVGRLMLLLQRWVRTQPERIPGITVGDIEVVSSTATRGALDALLGVARRFFQIAILYFWAVFSLSLFERTHDYATRITGMVVAPLSSMVTRVGGALPILVVVVVAAAAVALLERFLGLFFRSVERGETHVSWLPAELAAPTGALVRIGVVVLALLVAAPLLTGGNDDALGLLGRAAAGALALASVPLLATVSVGAVVVYGRRVRRGDRLEFGSGDGTRRGTVTALTLLDVQMSDDAGGTFRIPHLASLTRPLRVGGVVRASLSLHVARAGAPPPDEIRTILSAGAAKAGSDVTVVIAHADGDSLRFDVSCRPIGDSDLGVCLLAALEASNVKLLTRVPHEHFR